MDLETTWSPAGWIARILAVAVTISVTVVFDLLVLFVDSGTCGDMGAPDAVLRGRLTLLAVLLVVGAVWGSTVWTSRRRVAAGTLAAVAILPAAVFALAGLTDGAWTGGFCF